MSGVGLETARRELGEREKLEHGNLDKRNADLSKTGQYNKLQQQRITALADIRHSAAHGKADEFLDRAAEDMSRDLVTFGAEQLWRSETYPSFRGALHDEAAPRP